MLPISIHCYRHHLALLLRLHPHWLPVFLCTLVSCSTPKPLYLQTETGATITLPPSFQLNVPFTSQAPFEDWGMPYQEACEEASLAMVHFYIEKKGTLTGELDRNKADEEILQLSIWELTNGYAEDVSLEELSSIARDFYGHYPRIENTVTRETIMWEISQGNPVIVPAAGRELGNPYFSGEGPWYHMLVITGYTPTHFIVNDPGTKRGYSYQYRHRTVLNAIHDWTGVKQDITNGPKRMLIVE